MQMAHRKYKFGAGVSAVVLLGIGFPVMACVWQQKKAAAPRSG